MGNHHQKRPVSDTGLADIQSSKQSSNQMNNQVPVSANRLSPVSANNLSGAIVFDSVSDSVPVPSKKTKKSSVSKTRKQSIVVFVPEQPDIKVRPNTGCMLDNGIAVAELSSYVILELLMKKCELIDRGSIFARYLSDWALKFRTIKSNIIKAKNITNLSFADLNKHYNRIFEITSALETYYQDCIDTFGYLNRYSFRAYNDINNIAIDNKILDAYDLSANILADAIRMSKIFCFSSVLNQKMTIELNVYHYPGLTFLTVPAEIANINLQTEFGILEQILK